MANLVRVDWKEARLALGDVTERLTALLRSVERPETTALGDWNVAQLATHLSHAFDIVPGLASQTRSSPLAELWDLTTVTAGLLDDDAERDLNVLADKIDAGVAGFLSATARDNPDDPCPWLIKGTTVPMVTITCHLLNEAVVHGYDIATAVGKPWTIEKAHAAMIFEGFLLVVFQVVEPHALVDQERAAGIKACYDIQLRGAGRFVLVFNDGALSVEAPSQRRVDCHLSADPVAFLLVAWNRKSQWEAIPKGQIMAWGRRPWLGLKMRSLLRNP